MNEGDYEGNEYCSPEDSGVLDRRGFIQVVGGGVFVFATLKHGEGFGQRRRQGEKRADFNTLVRIGEDGEVTCIVGKIEMGQGPITSLVQMLADELDVALESVTMLMGDTALCPYDAGTWGSTTTPQCGPVVRAAGAEARAVLIELAAEKLNVPKERLISRDGMIIDKTSKDRSMTYADLAKGKRIERFLEQDPDLKSPEDFSIIGKPFKRVDAVEKVTGRAKYTGDITEPGMVCASVLRPPAHNATLESVDTSSAERIDGVQTIREGDLIAVLHEKPDIAEQALTKVKAEWNVPKPEFDDRTIFNYLIDNAGEGDVRSAGDIAAGERLAATEVEGEYLDGYVAHAPIETHTALAHFEGDKLTAWVSTQTPFGCRGQLAEHFGLPVENVRVIVPFVGGGFGGKIANGQAVEAARLAKAAQKPVRVAWTRAEEFFNDTYRPAAAVKINSGMTEDGRIVFWDYRVYGAGRRGSGPYYSIPHHRTTTYEKHKNGQDLHIVPTGPWRAPDNSTNSFARESHIDVMATRVGMDPVEFRLKNLTDEGIKRVLKAAADKFGWSPGKAPSGRGYGVACGEDVRVPVALMAEVEVNEKTGEVQVKRVVCAQDLGLVINPEGAALQIEGCITMGLGYSLMEDAHIEGGHVLTRSFSSYKLPRFSQVPQIEYVNLEADKSSAKGGGEPAIVCMGGVIANAIHDAIGSRVTMLPMTAERVKRALSS
jgi:isoquinoline 1-oxidoreductase